MPDSSRNSEVVSKDCLQGLVTVLSLPYAAPVDSVAYFRPPPPPPPPNPPPCCLFVCLVVAFFYVVVKFGVKYLNRFLSEKGVAWVIGLYNQNLTQSCHFWKVNRASSFEIISAAAVQFMK